MYNTLSDETADTITKRANQTTGFIGEVVATVRMRAGCDGGGKGALVSTELSLTLAKSNDQTAFTNSIARRLTPLECERLQGFPDNYTNIPGAKDAPRYAAIGNSMAVPVMRWIGERIVLMDKVLTT